MKNHVHACQNMCLLKVIYISEAYGVLKSSFTLEPERRRFPAHPACVAFAYVVKSCHKPISL